jgi:molybdate transport system substrate-binding protein
MSAVVVLGFLGASCGSDDGSGSAASTPATDAPTTVAATEAPTTVPTVRGDVTVFAAASLTAAFTEIGDAFMVDNPDANVTLNFAASSELVTQIGEGAPADVFASADLSNMTKLTDAGGNATEPVVFATNIAEIIVGAGNPKGITGVADLANPDLIVVQCAPEVPCGKYAAQIYEDAGVTVTPKSFEENVKAVVTKVTLGEADCGIVYATDVTAAGADAEGVEIPEDINVVAEYPIAATKAAPNPDGAQAFIDFLLSEQGEKILASYGFLAP